MSQPTIVIATQNAGKLREIQATMGDMPVQWETLARFGDVVEPIEDGATFLENAAIKARYYSKLTGCWTLADDSGLVVDALDGDPGVYSARYAGDACDDAANNRKLIERLHGVPMDKRTARFVCSIACADGETILAEAEGRFEGLIVDEPRGANGFGYDPHFLVPSLGRTSAELEPEHKNSISHRGEALAAIRPKLRTILNL